MLGPKQRDGAIVYDVLEAISDLPVGWTFRSRILEDELIVDTSETVATVLQDELENTYTLPR